MSPVLANFLVIAIVFLAAITALAIAYGIASYVRTHKEDFAFKQVLAWGALLVNAAEQQLSLDGPRKKEIVMLQFKALRDAMHSTLTDEQLELIVEANVRLMNGLAGMLEIEAFLPDLEEQKAPAEE